MHLIANYIALKYDKLFDKYAHRNTGKLWTRESLCLMQKIISYSLENFEIFQFQSE